MSKPILSILTPTVAPRRDKLESLIAEVNRQCEHVERGTVEHLWLGDNYNMTVGEKRNALIAIARGKYLAFVDDDEEILDGYVLNLVTAAIHDRDVITFRQQCFFEHLEGEIEFRLSHRGPDEQFVGGLCKRGPWHCNAWRSSLAKRCMFPALNWGEDVVWAHQARELARSEVHLNGVLCVYRHIGESESDRRVKRDGGSL